MKVVVDKSDDSFLSSSFELCLESLSSLLRRFDPSQVLRRSNINTDLFLVGNLRLRGLLLLWIQLVQIVAEPMRHLGTNMQSSIQHIDAPLCVASLTSDAFDAAQVLVPAAGAAAA